MTEEKAVNNNNGRNYLKVDHKGMMIERAVIAKMSSSFLLISFVFFAILLFGGWTPCFGTNKEITRAMGITGLTLIISMKLYYLCTQKKCTGSFDGGFSDLISAFKQLGIYISHKCGENGEYEIRAAPVTLSRKELIVIKDNGFNCKITGEKNYMKYLSRYLVDLKLK